MEEIVEGVARIVSGFLRWLLWELFFRFVFFNIGRVILLVVTLCRYPGAENGPALHGAIVSGEA